MAKFLIEVPHDPTLTACIHAVEIFHQTGSHFLTHADWGCLDGDHRAVIIVDVGSKQEARGIVPPVFRSAARVVELNTFTPEQLEELHRKRRAGA